MWIVLKNSFLSIVEDFNDPKNLLVRARIEGDIEKIFPDFEVFESLDSDYRFRSFIPRENVISAISEEIKNIDYPNFKNRVYSKDQKRASYYTKIWRVMHSAQSKI